MAAGPTKRLLAFIGLSGTTLVGCEPPPCEELDEQACIDRADCWDFRGLRYDEGKGCKDDAFAYCLDSEEYVCLDLEGAAQDPTGACWWTFHNCGDLEARGWTWLYVDDHCPADDEDWTALPQCGG